MMSSDTFYHYPQKRPAPLGELDALAQIYLSHAQFKPALLNYCSDLVEASAEPWPFAKLFNQFARYMICYMLIHNYFAWRLGAGPPPTLAALQRVVPSSPRQTAGFVAALKAGRLVSAEDAAEDRRIRLLRPAEAVIRAIGRSGLGFITAAEWLECAGTSLSSRLMTWPDTQGELLYRSAAFVLVHGTLIDPFPRILGFARRDCGYLVLCTVMQAHYAAANGRAPDVALTQKALARRFRVSPAHVGNLLGEAHAEGWFQVGAPGQLKAIDPTLVTEFERWAAWQMAHYRTLAATVGEG